MRCGTANYRRLLLRICSLQGTASAPYGEGFPEVDRQAGQPRADEAVDPEPKPRYARAARWNRCYQTISDSTAHQPTGTQTNARSLTWDRFGDFDEFLVRDVAA